MTDKNLKRTPLLEEHTLYSAKMAPFGGWFMPIQYEGILAEHQWTRQCASLFDICHMGELIVYGDAIKSNLDGIVTHKISSMPVSTCRYGFMLNKKGGIIDDLVIYRLEKEKWMLVVNAATTDKDEAHLLKHLSKDAILENHSNLLAKLDIQGPVSQSILKALIGDNILDITYYRFKSLPFFDSYMTVSRTGYTGELGYEIYISSKRAVDLWKFIMADDRVKPAGLGARDTLRLEMGYPLYGQDIDEGATPFEAGLDRFVDMDKEFIGKNALLSQKKKGLTRKLVCFKTNSRRAPRHDNKIFSGAKEIGIVKSGSFSPSLSCGIGMGYVVSAFSKTGSDIKIVGNRAEIDATIADKPFYNEGSARK
ncbi:glycine cleavage system aminomethyltransferase GcvT [Candidatus Omnitrophota bacterium]